MYFNRKGNNDKDIQLAHTCIKQETPENVQELYKQSLHWTPA